MAKEKKKKKESISKMVKRMKKNRVKIARRPPRIMSTPARVLRKKGDKKVSDKVPIRKMVKRMKKNNPPPKSKSKPKPKSKPKGKRRFKKVSDRMPIRKMVKGMKQNNSKINWGKQCGPILCDKNPKRKALPRARRIPVKDKNGNQKRFAGRSLWKTESGAKYIVRNKCKVMLGGKKNKQELLRNPCTHDGKTRRSKNVEYHQSLKVNQKEKEKILKLVHRKHDLLAELRKAREMKDWAHSSKETKTWEEADKKLKKKKRDINDVNRQLRSEIKRFNKSAQKVKKAKPSIKKPTLPKSVSVAKPPSASGKSKPKATSSSSKERRKVHKNRKIAKTKTIPKPKKRKQQQKGLNRRKVKKRKMPSTIEQTEKQIELIKQQLKEISLPQPPPQQQQQQLFPPPEPRLSLADVSQMMSLNDSMKGQREKYKSIAAQLNPQINSLKMMSMFSREPEKMAQIKEMLLKEKSAYELIELKQKVSEERKRVRDILNNMHKLPINVQKKIEKITKDADIIFKPKALPKKPKKTQKKSMNKALQRARKQTKQIRNQLV